MKFKKLLCKLFEHRMNNNNIADFTCLRCGEHIKIEWPKPPPYKPSRREHL